jgi:hypothetical protein
MDSDAAHGEPVGQTALQPSIPTAAAVHSGGADQRRDTAGLSRSQPEPPSRGPRQLAKVHRSRKSSSMRRLAIVNSRGKRKAEGLHRLSYHDEKRDSSCATVATLLPSHGRRAGCRMCTILNPAAIAVDLFAECTINCHENSKAV